jgi:hypothetical protein
MSKQSPRPSVRKLFDIRSIPKKPPAPSLNRRCQDAVRTKVKIDKGKQ